MAFESEETGSFAFENEFVIERLEGLEVVTDIKSSKRFDGKGECVIGSTVEPLHISISGSILNNKKNSKAQLVKIFQPNTKGKLIYNDDIEVEAYVSQSPSPERYYQNSQFSLELFIPVPFWQKKTAKNTVLKGIQKLFKFPYDFSIPFMLGRSIDYNDIYNDGNAQKDYVIRFFAKKQGVLNPVILYQKTGEFLKLLHTFEEGQRVVIDTRNNQMRAYICNDYWKPKREISDKLDKDSEVFTLQSGSNVIKLSTDAGMDDLTVSFYFNEIVAGIY